MRLNTKEKSAFARNSSLSGGKGSCVGRPRAFTLVELIVVISIITLLMSISLPVFSKVRQNARWIITMNNQREIVTAVNSFACNNDNSYPDSTATVTYGNYWDWQAPLMMTAIEPRPNKLNRSMSSYLFDYIDNADVLFCPDAPRKDDSLQQAWEAGEDWYNPLTNHECDHFFGTYCFYWNYIGYLGKRQPPFRGPRGLYTSGNESTLLVSCYLGYDYYRSPETFVSCEKFDDAQIVSGTEVSSDLWSFGGSGESTEMDSMKLKLHGGYVDGHVESYCPSDTVQMEVAGDEDGSCAYNNGYGGPGVFYIPEKSLPQNMYR